MSAHLRLLSAAALPLPLPASSSFRRARLLPPAPPLLLARSRGLGLSPRAGAAVRCRCVALESAAEGAEVEVAEEEGVMAPDAGIWEQVRDVVVFAGPALGLWICGPLMSLIDTMVIGQTSSLQLAALGPGTVFCDYLCYIFMFLSIATSNMVATSLANKLPYAG